MKYPVKILLKDIMSFKRFDCKDVKKAKMVWTCRAVQHGRRLFRKSEWHTHSCKKATGRPKVTEKSSGRRL